MTDTPDTTLANGAGPKLVQMPTQINKLAAEGESLKRNLDILIETQKEIAKYRRAAFLAYVENGFTEAQALELCCK